MAGETSPSRLLASPEHISAHTKRNSHYAPDGANYKIAKDQTEKERNSPSISLSSAEFQGYPLDYRADEKRKP